MAVLAALLIVPQAFADNGFLKSVEVAQKRAKEKKQLIFVDLFAEWCGWCHRFAKEVVPSEAFQKATDDMVLLKLDTEDRGEGTQFARRYQITSLPTFAILDSDLSVAGLIRGYAPAAQFSQMVEETVQKYRKFQKLVEQEPALNKDYAKRLEIAREFRVRQAFTKSESRLKKLVTEKGVPVVLRDDAWYELSVLYMQQSQFDQALMTIKNFKKAQTKGDSLEKATLLISDVHLSQGNYRAAAKELRDFKAKFPNSAHIRNIDMILPNIERMVQ